MLWFFRVKEFSGEATLQSHCSTYRLVHARRVAYRFNSGVGIANSTNSSNFRPGDVIIRIHSVGPFAFTGEQIYRDGRWYRIRDRLAPDGRLYIDGERNVSWFMDRIE